MRVSPLEGHRLWAPTFESGSSPLIALETRILSERLRPLLPAKRFVDVACGAGRWMHYLLERGAAVTGIDFCPEMLAEAQNKTRLNGRLVLGNVDHLPFSSEIADVTLCSLAVSFFPRLNRALSEIARITKPGGTVIVTDMHPAGILAGWVRAFRLGPSVYEIEQYSPSIDDLCEAGRRSRLQLQSQLEGCFSEPERKVFQAAGKESLFHQASRIPALWVGIWNKP